ncbi:MAG: 3'(2'),5'-bisphosphate nucleotidase CysQ [Bacteroidia bacterium]
MQTQSIDTHILASIARDAGAAIMAIYEQPDEAFKVSSKTDNSPLTAADRAANQVIVDGLERHFSHIPILSEEGKAIAYEQRKEWKQFWLVDPLDGTKEFIKRNGEFTVNIALIEDGKPIAGVVYAPVLDRMFVGEVGKGAFEIKSDGSQTRLSTTPYDATKANLRVVASRSHPSPALEAFMDTLDEPTIVNMGSSLKIMLIATGEADVYPRLGPTMEWDTGAAHAVLAAAGGTVLRHDSQEPLIYNKEDLLNPWFVAY